MKLNHIIVSAVLGLISVVSADKEISKTNEFESYQQESVLFQRYSALKEQKFSDNKASLACARNIFNVEEKLELGNVRFYEEKEEILSKMSFKNFMYTGGCMVATGVAFWFSDKNLLVGVSGAGISFLVYKYNSWARDSFSNKYVIDQLTAAQKDKRAGMSASDIELNYNLTPAVAGAL